VNLAQIRSAVPDIFHTQKSHRQHQKKTFTQFTACGNEGQDPGPTWYVSFFYFFLLFYCSGCLKLLHTVDDSIRQFRRVGRRESSRRQSVGLVLSGLNDGVTTARRLTDDVDVGRRRDLAAGVGRLDAVDARVLGLVEPAYLERARLAAVVTLRDDVLRVGVDADAVLEPRHGRVRDAGEVALEQQRRALRRVRRLERLRQLRHDHLLLGFCTRARNQVDVR